MEGERLPPNADTSSLLLRPSPRNIIRHRVSTEPVPSSSSASAGAKSLAKGATSPHDGADTFKQSLSISLDEPVGSMSISPANRDVALGARKGLFIVDLENPFDQPRFLAHSATWDVADVQWSIHPARSSWIVSTSSEKALVWNLDFPHSSDPRGDSAYASSNSPIEHVLDAHTRAICDINWSVFNPDVLATCGMDSCVMSWDLRIGGRSPSMNCCAWGSPATQVKWNRQDPHLIASSHDSRVLVWDTRKAALPMVEIKAHSQKIYGIDWSRRSPEALVTCSLDKSIRFWSTREPDRPGLTINTPSPVWRARHLPFGRGVLTLPQRHDSTLHLWAKDRPSEPVATFAGHADTVHEFVWRVRGGGDASCDDREFQLVTWGKDRKLRLWPVADDVLRSVGHRPGQPIDVRITRQGFANRSYRRSTSLLNPFTPSSPSYMSPAPFRGGHAGSAAAATSVSPTEQRRSRPAAAQKREVRHQFRRPGVMTRATIAAPRPHAEERLAWMEGVKLFKKGDTGLDAPQVTMGPLRSTRSVSPRLGSTPALAPGAVESKDDPEPQNLGEELRSVARKLSRVTFETLAVQARSCSVGLYGPWAARKGVAFLRATFSFPNGYPSRRPPVIEIERSADVSAKTRAWLLRTAREVMRDHVEKQNGAPSLEACLRLLLGEMKQDEEDKKRREKVKTGPGSSSSEGDSADEEDIPVSKIRPEVLRNNKNVPLPRRSGACFGPQGQMVVFFSADSRLQMHESRESVSRSLPPQHIKFEAFGTLASTVAAPEGEHDTSESDDALRMPRSRRLGNRVQSLQDSSHAIAAPMRRIATTLSIFRLSPLAPWSTAAHFGRDVDVDAVAKSLAARGDLVGKRVVESMGHWLAARMGARWTLLAESLGYLKGRHDLEVLGAIAVVLETLRRRSSHPSSIIAPTQKAPTRDYFSPRSPMSHIVPSPAGLPPAPHAVADRISSSFSPSKGSWGTLGAIFSNSMFSLRSGSPMEHGADEMAIRAHSPLAAVMTPTHEDAVAVLKHLATVGEGGAGLGRTSSRAGGGQSSGESLRSPASPVVARRPLDSGPKKKRRKQINIQIISPPTLQSTAPRLDALTEAQMELHRHTLADSFLRRGDPVTRATVLQSLRANERESTTGALQRHRAKMASGIDPSTRLELCVLCGTCGSRLEPSTRRCFKCSRSGSSAICALCRTKTEGMSQNCGLCLHGGHVACVESWFAHESACPAGCDCSCAADGGLAGVFAVPGPRLEPDVPAVAWGEDDTASLSTLRTATPRRRGRVR